MLLSWCCSMCRNRALVKHSKKMWIRHQKTFIYEHYWLEVPSFWKSKGNTERWDDILQPHPPVEICYFWAQDKRYLALPKQRATASQADGSLRAGKTEVEARLQSQGRCREWSLTDDQFSLKIFGTIWRSMGWEAKRKKQQQTTS